ncbi:glycosyltransferase [Marinifilum caeruleilacunae]|uniref:Glycosyltransferase n=1 Tax=Marinifilum caeruleilacunae TaxID=2499076 RepID=A0ABX1WTM5_9BACT|nr:glycosyltransferase [Marinifilum caeruleilacunae]NOU59273.1 glycosyltransferase [Marinifilum caeruleilacunae]
MNKPLVSVKTITYNHEKYIAQCIEGILNQKTNFDFEYIIGEDCSTDNTMQIVQEYANKYPNIIRIISSEENVGATKNDQRTDEACIGKYVAFCEGDDFWTDPYKLQKQVDFMEANPEYGLVHTNFSCIKGEKVLKGFRDGQNLPTGNILSELIRGNHIATASVCMRNDLLQSIRIGDPIRKNNWRMGDYPLWIEAAARTKIHYMADDTITYRIHNTSATHGLDVKGDFNFFNDRYAIKRHYIKKFACKDLEPFINKMYHRELLKFAIFLKDEKLRETCLKYFKASTMGESFPYLMLSQYTIFDPLYCFVYTTRKKLKMVV